MKMHTIIDGVFWGVLLIAIGASLILQVKMPINIFRLAIALVFIYIAIKVLVGGFGVNDEHNAVFSNAKMEFQKEHTDYNIIFSSGVVDLTKANTENSTKRIEVNAVFGSAKVYIPADMPAIFTADSAFGKAVMPDRSYVTFGSTTYTTKNFSRDEAYLEIKVASVFGAVEVIEK